MWGVRSELSDKYFFDQILAMIEGGQISLAVPIIAGHLYASYSQQDSWIATRDEFQRHCLHAFLLQDPYIARALSKPRGYAGDAVLMDLIYDRDLPEDTPADIQQLFAISTGFQGAEGVRQRRDEAARFLSDAVSRGEKVCVLACGHLREADALTGQDLSRVTAVDQDSLSLEFVRRRHGDRIRLVEANVLGFLRRAAAAGETYDLIYSLGLTDYLDDRAMRLLHRLMRKLLAPGGTIRLANFVPYHLSIGWMDAVMDWQLIYRTEAELASFAREIGMDARTWIDATGCIAWCEMTSGD